MTWLQRFWSKVQISGTPVGCWPWSDKPDQDGYGLLRIFGENYRAHRLMWTLVNGQEPPEDKPYILHSCDNPIFVSIRNTFVLEQQLRTTVTKLFGREVSKIRSVAHADTSEHQMSSTHTQVSRISRFVTPAS